MMMPCDGCLGECCFSPWEASVEEYQRIAFRHPIQYPTRIIIGPEKVSVGSNDTPCPYLDIIDMKCRIYYDRPRHCREKGSDKLPCEKMIKDRKRRH